ncbi:class IV adenylate cyclase [Providencia rettgeri]|uniref:Class IV adenylate cyclase n=1 Tax=Providencia rettgeri TaxID=587 RepID=A0AAD2VRB4_PRORE|nr:class IV adenylate cyclase [Providencia rettgeri]
MSQHFVGKYEAEIKFQLPDPDTFLHKIRADLAEPFTENNIETDYFYENPHLPLADNNVSMCVREMVPSGIKLWIVKGPGLSECKAINIDDCRHVQNMLTTLGYHCYLTTTKVRSIYFLNDIHITIDHLSGIGWFAEFAIMTDEQDLLDSLYKRLMATAKQYGFTEEMVETRSYKQMFLTAQPSYKEPIHF